MGRVSFSGLKPVPGERRSGMVAVPGIEPAWEMPSVVVRGQHDGPTLVVTGGMHAAEYVSIEAVTRLSRWPDPAELHGTLIAVLIVNMPGFFEHSIYVNPVDGKDFGGLFPGNPSGTASERVVDFLMTELIDGADAYVDAHCGDMIEALVPFTLWPRVDDAEVSSNSSNSIRIKPTKVSAKRQAQAGSEAVACEWAGCKNKGAHRAPKGRENSREYWHFCLDHVREYNQSYNFFQGINPDDVARYQKDALTGHRPTWKMGANSGAKKGEGDLDGAADPFHMFSELNGHRHLAAGSGRAGADQAGSAQGHERRAQGAAGDGAWCRSHAR